MPKVLEHVKDDILNTARQMIIVEELKKISIREVASRCNISTGTIYNYFDSKQDIIVSVAWQEWYSALNKIDTTNASTISPMDKLNFIFLELRSFLNIVHNMQSDDFYESVEIDKLMKMRKNKKDLHELLSSKVYDALEEVDIPQQDSLIYSIVIKLFCSYAMSPDINFEDLKPYIEKLIS